FVRIRSLPVQSVL
ncbi:tcdB toxin N-terminal helical domain protein, partial [Chlamydia psittaci 03DC29]